MERNEDFNPTTPKKRRIDLLDILENEKSKTNKVNEQFEENEQTLTQTDVIAPVSTTSLIQTVTLNNINSHEVFETFLDSTKHATVTDQPAEICREVNGSFSVYGGLIEGTILEMVKDQKIVMNWRLNDW